MQAAANDTADEGISARLDGLRALMRQKRLDVLWVRSTDRYLNEYVPTAESTRAWLTGFTGSVGEALVTPDRALVFVDGRYYLQAEREVDQSRWTIVHVPLGQSIEATAGDALKGLLERGRRVGYEPERFSVHDFERIQQAHPSAEWVACEPSLVEEVRGPLAAIVPREIRAVDETKLDTTAAQKIATVSNACAQLGVDALLVQTLDEIAYLSNLRGDDLPYQATFRSIALIAQGRMTIACAEASTPPSLQVLRKNAIDFAPSLDAVLQQLAGQRIGYEPRATTVWGRSLLERARAVPVSIASPVGPMKAKKGPKELRAMVQAFARADAVVSRAADWLCAEVSKGAKLSEADFADKVEALFLESGATGLSFKVISAAGRNGAVIHYSQPNKKRIIRPGELMLLDTGAYYAEGYATDLTRTFLVGPKSQKASPDQRRYFTLVLKSAIAGMRARIPVGTRGDQLDAIARAPLWAAGLNYNHGTGHGVGINVHEFPPRIGPQGTAALEEGMVFSIEPGVYVEKFGGVRIENLCTLERVKNMANMLQVRPLTFSPLDQRLIDRKLLNEEEAHWLGQYMRGNAPK